MGIARTNGKASNHTQRLTALAAEFNPTKGPYWVSQPDNHHFAQGWWWIPDGAPRPAFLGHNHITAEVDLRRLSDGHYRPAVGKL